MDSDDIYKQLWCTPTNGKDGSNQTLAVERIDIPVGVVISYPHLLHKSYQNSFDLKGGVILT